MNLPSYVNSAKDAAWFLVLVTLATGIIAGLTALRNVQAQVAGTVAKTGY